ncbi:MAG TPA: hypothetical protein VLJ61_12495 [Pyrinomonadaceae bacterium]|nr:hypothetical protein [Pyrinomonadaceae bacterium]
MRSRANEIEKPHADEAPPFGRSWATLYVVVLATLAILVALFYLFTRTFG